MSPIEIKCLAALDLLALYLPAAIGKGWSEAALMSGEANCPMHLTLLLRDLSYEAQGLAVPTC